MVISIAPPKLTLIQKAKFKKLNEMLSISDIALLRWYPENEYVENANSYAFLIADACMQGEIICFHDIRQHDWQWLCENPGQKGILDLPLIDCDATKFYPDSEQYKNNNSVFCLENEWIGYSEPRPNYKYNDRKSRLERFYSNNYDNEAFHWHKHEYATGRRCYISGIEFKHWLEKKGDWPLSEGCLLLNWFDICSQTTNLSKPEAEGLADDGGGNTCKNTNFLNAPGRQDDWFEVINDMTTAFYNELGQLPKEIQAWGRLWTSPPAGYQLTTGKDKGGEDCLNMPGTKPLSKSAFSKRWQSYTADKT